MAESHQLVQKLWNYCNALRDDGLSYGDYPSTESILSATEGRRTGSEQLTYLLFLKMAEERTMAPYSQPSIVPSDLCVG